jgi:hypothetical protein
MQHWYTREPPITAEMVKGTFENQYRPFYEPKTKGGRMLNQRGFIIQQVQSQQTEKALKRKKSVMDRELKKANFLSESRRPANKAGGEENNDQRPQRGQSRKRREEKPAPKKSRINKDNQSANTMMRYVSQSQMYLVLNNTHQGGRIAMAGYRRETDVCTKQPYWIGVYCNELLAARV